MCSTSWMVPVLPAAGMAAARAMLLRQGGEGGGAAGELQEPAPVEFRHEWGPLQA